MPDRKKYVEQSPEELIGRIRFPRRNELEQFAVVMQLLGVDKIRVACEDGKERLARIPGRMRKRVWGCAKGIWCLLNCGISSQSSAT